MADTEREEMIEQAHKLYDNSRNLISELRWQRTYFCRGTNIISKQEKLFNIWIFDECLKRLEERKSGLHWIERFDDENKWLECPHCHIDSAEAYNYCPNCGASFKEEKRGSGE